MSNNAEHLSVSLPDQKNYEVGYGLAYKLAVEKLSSFENLERQCINSGSSFSGQNGSGIIALKYLNRYYRINIPSFEMSLQGSNEKVELRDKILILHYLTQARGTALTNNLISYQELRDGSNYYPTFVQRAVKPLADYFGQSLGKLFELSMSMGAYRANLGDMSVTIPAFTGVPITLVVWRGDEEFPPNSNILFDSAILDYLPLEDVTVLCQTIVWKLVRLQNKPN